MKTSLFQFNQNAPGQYWFLYFLGKFGYENNMLSVRLHFINTHQPNSLENFFQKEYQEEIIVSIHMLIHITIGSIYNKDGSLLSNGNGLKLDSEKVTINPGYYFSKKKIEFIGNKNFPGISATDLDGFTYYTFNTGPRDKPTKVILPLGLLCQRLFFNSSRITTAIFKDSIEEILFNRTKRTIEKDGKIFGELKYDNSKGWTNPELLHLARLYFTKGEYGRAALNAIGLKVRREYLDYKNGAKAKMNCHYPEFSFPYQVPTSLNLVGKKFLEGNTPYFFAYDIKNVSFKESPLIVDEIDLIKAYPDRQKDLDSDALKFRNPTPTSKNKDHFVITSENSPYRQGSEIRNQPILDDFFTNIGIGVNFIQYQEPEGKLPENTIFLGSDRPYDGITSNIEQTDPDSDLMAQNSIKSEGLNRFDYIKEITKVLIMHNVSCSFNALGTGLGNGDIKTIEYEFGKTTKIMLVTLNFKNSFFYLMELTSGETGMFHSNTFEEIPPLDLEIISKRCIQARDAINFTQHMNNKSYWTIVRQDLLFLKKYGIKFLSPIRHESKNFDTYSELIKHASEKIFYMRILKLAA